MLLTSGEYWIKVIKETRTEGQKLIDNSKLRWQNSERRQQRNEMTKSWSWKYRERKKDDRDEASALRLWHSRQREQRKCSRSDMQIDDSITEKNRECRWWRWLSMGVRREEKWKILIEKWIKKFHSNINHCKENFSFTRSFFWTAEFLK